MSNQEEKKVHKNSGKSTANSSIVQLDKINKPLISWSLVVTFFLIMGLTAFYFASSFRLIDQVTVSGTDEVYDQVVLETSGLESGESIWENYIRRNEIENRITEEIPQVSNAEISFSGIQDFVITINEFETVAYLFNNNEYKKVLENGLVLEDTVPRPAANQPILNDFNEGPALERILDEYQMVEEDIKVVISEIEYIQNERNQMLVRVFMNDNNEVLVSIPSFADRLNYYEEMKEAVGDENGTFDLEAGAYFIPYDSEINEEGEQLNNEE